MTHTWHTTHTPRYGSGPLTSAPSALSLRVPFLWVCVPHRPRDSFLSPFSLPLCLCFFLSFTTRLRSPPSIRSHPIGFYFLMSTRSTRIQSHFPPRPLPFIFYLAALPSSHALTPPRHLILIFFSSGSACDVLCFDWTPPSHPSHPSLNGLSPTTISPCSHSSFPSPLSLSR